MSKILIMQGSQRNNGNSQWVADYIFSHPLIEQEHAEVVSIAQLQFRPCIACGYCSKTGTCFMKDELTPYYEKINQSVLNIFITPIYFNGVPAVTKGLIDRMQSFYAAKYEAHKPSIDRSKARMGFAVHFGGQKFYPEQFLSNQFMLQYYYKTINTKLLHHVNISDSDKVPIQNQTEKIKEIDLVLDQCSAFYQIHKNDEPSNPF